MKLCRYISYFEKDPGDSLVGEARFHREIPFAKLQRAFDVPANDPMVHGWSIGPEHLEFLQQYTTHDFQLENYVYFLDCVGDDNPADNHSVRVRDGAVVYTDPETGSDRPVEVVLDWDRPETATSESAGCGRWNTYRFFESATPGDVAAALAAGEDPNAQDDIGKTPLHWAAWINENAVVIRTLIAAGADPNVKDGGCMTPLHHASEYNDNAAVIQALIAAGANPNEQTSLDTTPLHLAAQSNENAAVTQALIASGANLESRNSVGDTALHMAAGYNENAKVTEALIAAGADPNAKRDDGWTALQLATENDQPAAVIRALILRTS